MNLEKTKNAHLILQRRSCRAKDVIVINVAKNIMRIFFAFSAARYYFHWFFFFLLFFVIFFVFRLTRQYQSYQIVGQFTIIGVHNVIRKHLIRLNTLHYGTS